MDAAEDDRLRVGRRGLARQPEGVADVVGHVLHLGHLVVVREDHGVSLARQRLDLVLHHGCQGRAHRTSRETSRERAEWVSAPIEMKSTPVSAIERMVSSVTPPEASSVARPAVIATASRMSAGGMLSSRMESAPAASASRSPSRSSTSTWTGTPAPSAPST